MEISPLGVFHAAAGLLLLGLGALALTARKSKTSRHPRVGEAYFWTLVVTLTTAMVVGLQDPTWSLFEVMTPPTFVLGLLGYVMAKRRPPNWLRWHIIGQGGSYIGVVTAFAFQVFPRVLPPSPLLTVAYWLVPTLIGTVLIVRTTNKWIENPGESTPVVTA